MITLEQAQAIVFGAIDYAADLGFKPHKDFQKTKKHLGTWNGQPKLTFVDTPHAYNAGDSWFNELS